MIFMYVMRVGDWMPVRCAEAFSAGLRCLRSAMHCVSSLVVLSVFTSVMEL